MKIKIEMSDGYYYSADIKQTDTDLAASTIQKTLSKEKAVQTSLEKAKLSAQFKSMLDTEIDKLVNTPSTAVTSSSAVSPSAGNAVSESVNTAGEATLDEIFDEAARTYGVEKRLLLAVAKQESDFDIHSTSGSGAMGVMQLIQETADELGVEDPYDPYQNIMGGAKYLRELLDRYDNDKELALAAYNAGWPAVDQYGGIPPYEETQNYVPLVMGYYEDGVEAPDDELYPTDSSSRSYADISAPLQSQSPSATTDKMSRDEAYAILMQGLNNAIQRLQ